MLSKSSYFNFIDNSQALQIHEDIKNKLKFKFSYHIISHKSQKIPRAGEIFLSNKSLSALQSVHFYFLNFFIEAHTY